jgi:hypothetical protein
MQDVFRAMAVSGGILLVVVVGTIGICMAVVNRGAKAMQESGKNSKH